MELGLTQGYRRTREGYRAQADAPKRVFVRPLCRDARAQLTHAGRDRLQLTGAPKIMLNAEQMRQLPQSFKIIPDPRRTARGGAIVSACGAGHRSGCDAVRHARVQSFLRLGRCLGAASPRTFWLLAGERTLSAFPANM